MKQGYLARWLERLDTSIAPRLINVDSLMKALNASTSGIGRRDAFVVSANVLDVRLCPAKV